jgi:hypothetical protein
MRLSNRSLEFIIAGLIILAVSMTAISFFASRGPAVAVESVDVHEIPSDGGSHGI